MKKKQYKGKLKLSKKVISNLQSRSIQGGTDSIGVTVGVTVDITIWITTQLSGEEDCEVSRGICETEARQYCISKPDPDCPTNRTC